MDEADPDGLMSAPTGAGVWSVNGGAMGDAAGVYAQDGHDGPWGGADGHYMRHEYRATTDGNVTTFQHYDVWVPDDPGLFDGVGGAFGVGLSAVGSQASFGLWNGGAARHDPSFGVSSSLAMAGMIIMPGGGEACPEEERRKGLRRQK